MSQDKKSLEQLKDEVSRHIRPECYYVGGFDFKDPKHLDKTDRETLNFLENEITRCDFCYSIFWKKDLGHIKSMDKYICTKCKDKVCNGFQDEACNG
jgi:hypothetical protein